MLQNMQTGPKPSVQKPNSTQLSPVFHRIIPPVSDLVSDSTTIHPSDLYHKVSSSVKESIFSQLYIHLHHSWQQNSQHSYRSKHLPISSFYSFLAYFQSQFVENTGLTLCALWSNLNPYNFFLFVFQKLVHTGAWIVIYIHSCLH